MTSNVVAAIVPTVNLVMTFPSFNSAEISRKEDATETGVDMLMFRSHPNKKWMRSAESFKWENVNGGTNVNLSTLIRMMILAKKFAKISKMASVQGTKNVGFVMLMSSRFSRNRWRNLATLPISRGWFRIQRKITRGFLGGIPISSLSKHLRNRWKLDFREWKGRPK